LLRRPRSRQRILGPGPEGARAGAYPFQAVPERPSNRSSSPVTTRPNPVGLLLAGATATLVHQDRPGRLIGKGHGLSLILKVEPAEEARVARRRAGGGRSHRRPRQLLMF